MYFKRLEMHGFKSFAEPVVIEFHEGITCIVGPNGSGKSNISDAIRWVLGEQSPKALRGGKMEEVIFNGTENRRPRGMAEVTLVIDNSAGILKIDYNEVAITRRMYRSGESEYLINNNACRLKDIRELIMDTGIGVDGYSIIGQGKIADIVSNKPESRREIFEEAAGIVAYKSRKAEAEKKLDTTKGNLERIDDIVGEIEGRIDGLRSDSEKAKRYLELKDRYKDLEINITLRNIENADKRNAQYKGDISEFEGKIRFIKENKRSVDIESAAAQDRNSTLDRLSNEAHDKLLRKVEDISRITSASQINEERLANIERDEKRINDEITELKGKEKDSADEIEKLRAEHDEILAKTHDAENDLQEKIFEYNQLTSDTSGFADTIDQGNDRMFNLHSEAESKKSEAKSIESYRSTLEKRQKQLKEETGTASKNIDTINTQLRDAEAEFKDANDTSERIEAEIIEKVRRNNELISQQSGLRSKIEDNKIKTSQMEARKTAIEEMESNYEGYNYAVKYIMKSGLTGIEGVAAELMKVPDGFETAIETAMGATMQNIICRDDECAKTAINALKHNKVGRLTFLPVASIKGRRANADPRFSEIEGFKGLGVDLVEFDRKYQNIFDYLLGRVAVVADMDTAIKMSKMTDTGLRFVTLEGEVVNASGAITGGRYKNNTANLLERKNEVAKLENDIKLREHDLETLKAKMEDTSSEIEGIARTLSKFNTDKSESDLKVATLRGKISTLKSNLKDNEGSLDKNNSELESISRELSEAEDMIARLIAESKAAEDEMNRISKEVETAMADYDSIKDDIEKANKAITDSRISVNKWDGRKTSNETILNRAKNDIDDLQSQINERESQLLDISKERNQMMFGDTDSEAQLTTLEQERKTLDDYITEIAKEKKELAEHIAEITDSVQAAENEINSYQDQKYQLEIKMAKNETQMDTMKDKLWDEFEISYVQAMDFRRDDFAMTSSTKECRDIKTEMRELGDINVGSIQEYDTVSERYKFLTDQRSDVLTAMNELEGIISDMDSTITRTFKDNFDQVEDSFERVFRELFGGGSAELRMENENDPLESGIDIVAQPPGKKLQNINLLSGGEKTMTAIALMFAVLRVKPTPFCILDEVEAALDDENIDRFSNYLKNYGETQFALITHQKATMEHADVLYGVTMPEHGISKVLSLRMGDYDPSEYTN